MSKKDEALKLAQKLLEYIDRQDNDRDFLSPDECRDLHAALIAIRKAQTEQLEQQPITGLDVYLDPRDGLKPKLYSPQTAQQELVALREVLPGRVCGYTPGMSRVELQLPEGTLIAGWLELGETVYIAPQPAQQEPVAFEIRAFNATQALIKRADVAQEKADVLERGFGSEADVTIVPLYTSQPAKKPWVGLTDKEWQEIDASLNGKRDLARIFVRAIEAKLREKNT